MKIGGFPIGSGTTRSPGVVLFLSYFFNFFLFVQLLKKCHLSSYLTLLTSRLSYFDWVWSMGIE